MFFKEILIIYNLGQNCWDKIKNVFLSENTPLAPDQCCSQGFGLLTTKLGQLQHWSRGVRGRIWSLKIEPFLEFTGFSTFVSTCFVQGCSFKTHSNMCTIVFNKGWWIINLKSNSKNPNIKLPKRWLNLDSTLLNRHNGVDLMRFFTDEFEDWYALVT